MTERVHHHPNLIYSPGTQVVTLKVVLGSTGRILHPQGAVGVVVRSPETNQGDYRVRFPDEVEATLSHPEIVSLARYKEGEIGDAEMAAKQCNLYDRVIYRCVVGSRAYGLDHSESDTDRRGIYVPPADLHWSLYGVPEQLENDESQEVYWEVQKFLVLALKANPNVLECLFTPFVELTTPLSEELLAMRTAFLSRMVYQTYNGYVMSQFKPMRAHIRNHGEVKWKHVMHLIRLLISGTTVLREGFVPVRVEEHREKLLTIKRGGMPWEEVDQWRRSLHEEFDRAFQHTTLRERPDYEKSNCFLVKVRRWAAEAEI
ncbi:MAG: nucleotidyltransferase domain-containing protein [Planctomycetaceae bacterium]|nr:nucleotidyltransferase domain-containing protein [Planctomycetaceae bacterium]